MSVARLVLASAGSGDSPDPPKMLAVASTAAPYVHVYAKGVDNQYKKLPTPADIPAGAATDCSFSTSGKFLAVAHANAPYITIYKRTGTTFTRLPSPATLPSGNARSCRFSTDDKYLAVGFTGVPYFLVYKRSGNTFVAMPSPASSVKVNSAVNTVAFSLNGAHLAMGATATAGATANPLYVYSKDQAGDFVVQTLKVASTQSGVTSTHYSPDGKFLLITNSGVSSRLYSFTDSAYTLLTKSVSAGNGKQNEAVWSADSQYVASGGSSTSGASYKAQTFTRDGTENTFTRRVVTPAMEGTVTCLAFSPDEDMLLFSCTVTPPVRRYTYITNTPTQIPGNPLDVQPPDAQVIALWPKVIGSR